ncbi:Poly(A) polymerase [Aureobasidium pullulans]|nr:Poly(A) polymerase [Aureobasidium pullulans]
MAATRQWGITPPVSTSFPTDKELALSEALVAELKEQKNFESTEDTNKRVAVLATFQRVTVEFVKHVGRLKGLPDSVLQNAGGKVFTFGSYRLGVFGPGSDIDTLVVAPKHVSRDDFFEHYRGLLESMSPPGSVEKCTLVPEAHVPIMKLVYQGIEIDLIFAPLQLNSVPPNLDLEDNSLLRGLDDQDLRSVNGTRVTDDVLRLVPQEKTFRHALRCIKLWASKRAIYGNIIGFPGGIAWALMVARIAQLYPNASSSLIVSRFFSLMKTWSWPMPIMLRTIESPGPLGSMVKIWNPRIYPADGRHIMPIITPAYPAMCATHNVTKSTLAVITRELERGAEICSQIFDEKSDKQWKHLFEGHTFFTKDFKFYLSIVSGSLNEESQGDWKGLVQSKVRRLIGSIEQSQPNVAYARPFTKGYERMHRVKNDEEKDQVMQGSTKYQISKTEIVEEAQNVKQLSAEDTSADNLNEAVSKIEKPDEKENGMTNIWTTTYYVGLELVPGELFSARCLCRYGWLTYEAQGAKTLDIVHPVKEFRHQCTQATQYNEDVNSIRVVVAKSYDLPDDVFQPGEQRPVKAKKAKAANGTKKRNAGEANLDENGDAQNASKRRQSGVTNGQDASNGVKT